MSSEDLEECVRSFDRLVVKAALLHPRTWCVARQIPLWTQTLRGQECCPCKHFIGNDGICDPL